MHSAMFFLAADTCFTSMVSTVFSKSSTHVLYKSTNFFNTDIFSDFSILDRSDKYFIDKFSGKTSSFFGRLKFIGGTSYSGKKSLQMLPFPSSLISQSTETPRPVPYFFLFRYKSSSDFVSSSALSVLTPDWLSANKNELLSVDTLI